jgi:hypothetical protein
MKLYQKAKDLSSEMKEILCGTACASLFLADLIAFPCFIGMTAGVEMAGWKAVLAYLFAAQIVALAVVSAISLVRFLRRSRKRCGMISDQEIRKIMGGARR